MTEKVRDSFNFILMVDSIKSKILSDYSDELRRYERTCSMKLFEMDCFWGFLQLKFNFSFEELKPIHRVAQLILYCNCNGNVTMILRSSEIPEISKQVKIPYDRYDKMQRKIKVMMTVIKDAIDTLKKELLENEISESRYGGIINWRQK